MTLDDWTAAVTLALGVDYNDPRTRDEVLLLARDAAHGVARPAAPLTTFLLGVAVGRGADLVVAAHQVRALLPGDDADTQLARTELADTQPAGTELAETDLAGTDLAGTDLAGTDRVDTEQAATDGDQDKAVFVQR